MLTRVIVPAAMVLLAASSDGLTASAPHRCIGAQLAIERVYWNNRLWPAGNPGDKPSFESVVSAGVIESRVADDLRKAAALAGRYGRSIRNHDLQAELDRMVSRSRQPRLLEELLEALGDDGELVAECLVRPALVDRLLRDQFAHDERIHGEARNLAGAFQRGADHLSEAAAWGGQYAETKFRRSATGATSLRTELEEDRVAAVELNDEQWNDLRARLLRPPSDAGSGSGGFAPDAAGGIPLVEDDQVLFSQQVIQDGSSEMTVATAAWAKVSFEDWWESHRAEFEALPMPAEAVRFGLPLAGSGACPGGTWDDSLGYSPEPRIWHAALWTGSEMFIWGGWAFGAHTQTGYLYNPATDVWRRTPVNALTPAARGELSAVWTGSELIVWGGYSTGTWYNDGARLDPVSNTWSPLGATGTPPSRRAGQSAVWTGTEMIVWGGYNGSAYLQTGGRFNPASGAWSATRLDTNTPFARSVHSAVWTGSEMVVWGGYNNPWFRQDGGRYDPATNTWRPMTLSGSPSARQSNVALWTGTRMLIWGGHGPSYLNSGGLYDPVLNTWSPTRQDTTTPQGRTFHAGVWTGTEMIVWGGRYFTSMLNTGARYDPAGNAWTPISPSGAPQARNQHTAVWTGTEMVVWGGELETANDTTSNTGGRFNPATERWTPTSVRRGPVARDRQATAWTGAEMIVFGGMTTYGQALRDGMMYRPATDSWTPLPEEPAAPQAKMNGTAVWSGSEVIVWGGYDGRTTVNSGARYSPQLGTWAPMSTSDAPRKSDHTAVWTGREMIVWGGVTITGGLLGARYDPAADSWTPMSALEAPQARSAHTSLWTGTEMIVWGGQTGYPPTYIGTGATYDPVTDLWASLSEVGSPIPRAGHAAIWTGSEMIVWGGSSGTPLADGARYAPQTNTWTPVSFPGPEQARLWPSAVWTGQQMLIWGGRASASLRSGAIYTPATNEWIPMEVRDAPQGRESHSTVWTGSHMLVWGGHREPVFGFLGDGGSFAPCPCADPETWYPDSDGDGFGDPLADVLLACGPAPGRAGNGLDCDDGHASVHPGAPQECGDELNNDCASPGWPLLDGTNEQDDDGDGLSECGGDCSDADSEVHPGAAEQCQGRDDDCDGFVDEGLPPGIVSVGFSPGQLWPPNHRMVEVTAKVDLTGGCTATCAGPSIRLDSITSSELDDTAGSEDGQTEDDIREANLGTTDFDFELRAERSGEGDGRLYRIRYAVTDCAGQQVDGEGGVFVPHDRAGVVEPLDLAFLDSDGDGSVVLSWNQMDRAIAYNVIMGRLKDVQAVGSWTVLHDTQCLLRRTSATSVPWPELVAAPAPGDAFFYLVEYFDGGYSGYGTASGERETVILSGDSCR